MRRPIQIQLLVPMLCVVLFAIVLASAATAYWGSVHAREDELDNLRRVVATVTETAFPLTDRVLQQMSGLSGAEFVLLDRDNRVQQSTLRLESGEADGLAQVPEARGPAHLAPGPAMVLGGRAYLAGRVPVAERAPRWEPCSLVVLYPEDRWTARVRQAAYPALLAGAAAAAMAVLTTIVLARRFVRPIRDLVVRTAAIAGGDFAPLCVSPRDDEIRDLTQSINWMAERLAHYESEIRRNERFRVAGQLGAGMAHQLRNAATGGRMAIELHQRACPVASADESLDVALRQLRVMETYLQRFLSLGAAPPTIREEVAVRDVIDDILAIVRPACAHAGIEIASLLPPEPLRLRGDAEAIRQLVVNLALNAVDAASAAAGRTNDGSGPPRILIAADRLGLDRGAIRVQDTGPGPDAAVRDRLFEPFATAKPEGVGLGLFVARQIAEAHGGSIAWRRQDGMTCFVFEFPLVSEADRVALVDRR
jgi:signal transduction histidine kinase